MPDPAAQRLHSGLQQNQALRTMWGLRENGGFFPQEKEKAELETEDKKVSGQVSFASR